MRTVTYNKHPPTIILTLQSLKEAFFKILFSDLLYKTQPALKPQAVVLKLLVYFKLPKCRQAAPKTHRTNPFPKL